MFLFTKYILITPFSIIFFDDFYDLTIGIGMRFFVVVRSGSVDQLVIDLRNLYLIH